jgi:cytoskeletal protein CcmA (bactofilin family)
MADPTPSRELSSSCRDASFSAVGGVVEHATIGPSIVIKGEVSGSEPLFVGGTVEGSIHVPNHRVTVGRSSRVSADIPARDIVLMGEVKGNIDAADLLDIRAESFIQGQMKAQRIRIDDGAVLKGSVEVHSDKHKTDSEIAKRPPSAPVQSEPVPAPKAESASAAVAAVHSARRMSGSRTLLEIEKLRTRRGLPAARLLNFLHSLSPRLAVPRTCGFSRCCRDRDATRRNPQPCSRKPRDKPSNSRDRPATCAHRLGLDRARSTFRSRSVVPVAHTAGR